MSNISYEPVDLEAISAELTSLDEVMSKTDSKISDFCKQLNIAVPF